MAKLVRCPACGNFFKPPKQAPFFPCPTCRERRLTQKLVPPPSAVVVQPEQPEFPKYAEPTHRVVVCYSLVEHIVFEGSFDECQDYMADLEKATDMAAGGYDYWVLEPVKTPKYKAEEMHPQRRCRTPQGEFRTKYSPHYPKARPVDNARVAEYQGYEVAGIRWVWD